MKRAVVATAAAAAFLALCGVRADAHNGVVTCTAVENIDATTTATVHYIGQGGSTVATFDAAPGTTAHAAPAGTVGYFVTWPDGYRVPNGAGYQPLTCATAATTTTVAPTTTAATTTTVAPTTTTVRTGTTISDGGPTTTLPRLPEMRTSTTLRVPPLCADGSPGTTYLFGPADIGRICPDVATATSVVADRLPSTGAGGAGSAAIVAGGLVGAGVLVLAVRRKAAPR